jgi:hypothetical protein
MRVCQFRPRPRTSNSITPTSSNAYLKLVRLPLAYRPFAAGMRSSLPSEENGFSRAADFRGAGAAFPRIGKRGHARLRIHPAHMCLSVVSVDVGQRQEVNSTRKYIMLRRASP